MDEYANLTSEGGVFVAPPAVSLSSRGKWNILCAQEFSCSFRASRKSPWIYALPVMADSTCRTAGGGVGDIWYHSMCSGAGLVDLLAVVSFLTQESQHASSQYTWLKLSSLPLYCNLE